MADIGAKDGVKLQSTMIEARIEGEGVKPVIRLATKIEA